MTIEQTIEIPPSHQLFINVPKEIPAGEAILTFTPAAKVSGNKDLDYAEKVWANNRAHAEEMKVKLTELQGSLRERAFGGLDGVAYQHKVRAEWEI